MSTHRFRRARIGLAAALTMIGLPMASVTTQASTASATPSAPAASAEEAEPFSALVFSKTAGFRHDSIPDGIAAIEKLGEENDFTVDATEDAGDFTKKNLAKYDVVIWLSTTGDVLNDQQQDAFHDYIANGGGYAGIHAAADTEHDWPWYGKLVGAYFESHPDIQEATIDVHDRQHPSTAELDPTWTRTDELYNYTENPRGKVHVLATLDEKSYEGGTMGADHPFAWCHDQGDGRSWYTGAGHTKESYTDPEFLSHILGGIQTAAGALPADCSATVDRSFEQVTLAKGAEKTGEPIAMAVLPNGDVLHTSRDGRIWHTTADATTSEAARIPVYNHDEDGVQGIAIDPDFERNRWVYVYYAPPMNTPAGDAPETGTADDFSKFDGHNQLSRFKFTEKGKLKLSSEQKILKVNTDRGRCCHAGGEIDFDPDGNLFLSTGDDTDPFASDGYAPIDEREDRNPVFDAQRTSANTNDLRGKLLRIKVGEGGKYTIPEGNLFTEGTQDTRPEIYAMGFRNPFRFSIDPETGWVYLGDYGPDAGEANPDRGPAGTVEFNLIKEPGNYGWPYCVGDNQPFRDYDFGTKDSGPEFNCDAPVNESPHNTGMTELPPVQPAWIPYDGTSVPEFGDGGESPMGGVVYNYDENLKSETKWPEYYDGRALLYEWDRAWIKEAQTDAEGNVESISPMLEWMDLRRPMNIQFGPDGSLYVLDYGGGYFGGDDLSAVYRIDYVKGNRPPQAVIKSSRTNGAAPLKVDFDGSDSTHKKGQTIKYAWDLDGDGKTDSKQKKVSYTYKKAGRYSPKLTVTDEEGRKGFASIPVTAGNTAPKVTVKSPVDGRFFSFGGEVKFQVQVKDPEDGNKVDCSRVTVEYILGHDRHGHPLSSETGCKGTLKTAKDEGHGLDANVFGVINATYTDGGGKNTPALTGDDEAKLHTRTKQAEFAETQSGVEVLTQEGVEGGKLVSRFKPGSRIAFDRVNLGNAKSLSATYTSGGTGGTLQVRSGSKDGKLVAKLALDSTGGWDQAATSKRVAVDNPGGTKKLFLVAKGPKAGKRTFDLDSLTFGASKPAPARSAEASTDTSAASSADKPARKCKATKPDKGYKMLYDGTAKSFADWKMAGPGKFVQRDDCTIVSRGGLGLLWHPDKQKSYNFKTQWKMAGDDNSGVFVGFPNPDDDPWSAVDHGYEIQIDATDEDNKTTGAVYDFQGADLEARDQALNPPGQWNSYRIKVEGQQIKIFLNGVLINDFKNTSPDRDLTKGFVGLQNHGEGDAVFFRDVQIKPLPQTH